MKKKDVLPAVELLQVTKTYNNGTTRAVTEVSLTIKQGEIWGLVGANGAGKTTLLKLAAGIIQPDAGRVRVAGMDVGAEPLKAKRVLGYAASEPLLYERMTGYQYLYFMAAAFGMGRDTKKRITELADEFGISDSLAGTIGHWPAGERQKLSLLAVFLHDPDIYVLDEPWANLDPVSQTLVKGKLKAAALAGKAVLFSTYRLDIAQKLAGRLAIMRRGVLAAAGTFAALKKMSGKKGAPLETVFLEFSQ